MHSTTDQTQCTQTPSVQVIVNINALLRAQLKYAEASTRD